MEAAKAVEVAESATLRSGGGKNAVAMMYMDLLEGTLTRTVTGGESYQTVSLKHRKKWIQLLWNELDTWLNGRGLRIVRLFKYVPDYRENGRDWPADAETMIGLKRMRNLRALITDVVARNVPGDFVETGVWRGGGCIFAKGVLAALGDTKRNVWVCDSFEGLPPPSGKYEADDGDKHHEAHQLAISEDQVRHAFQRYNLLDDRVKFVKGFFKDTLHKLPAKQIAVLRLDGDMYESTMDALTALYDKVPAGGYVIVDDYGAVAGCKKAIEDFRAQRGITAELVEIDWSGVYWQV